MNKLIESFEEFGTYQKVINERRQLFINIFEQFDDTKPYINEATLIVEAGVFDDLHNYDFIDESIIDKLIDKTRKAVAAAKEKGKAALTKTQEFLIKTGGKIGVIIKMMVTAVKEYLGKVWKAAQSAYKSTIGKSAAKIKEKIAGMSASRKDDLADEVKNLGKIAGAMGEWVKSGFIGGISKAADKGAKVDESWIGWTFELSLLENINEAIKSGELDFNEFINEAAGPNRIPYVSAIAKKMNEFVPFVILKKVKENMADKAGGVLNTLSVYATKLAGAPGPFKFVALATLIGVVGEVIIKGQAKHAIVALIPGIGQVAGIISNVAMALALIAAVEAAMGASEEKPKAEE